jgi:phosphoglycolate phosphatase-like HAD superfamily hydrolase
MIKLIIFDWDDVLTLGSTEGYYKCYHEAMKGVGVTLSKIEEKKRIDAKWGSSHNEELAELLKDNLNLLPRAVKIYENCLFGRDYVDCLTLVPGTIEMLNRLTKNYKIAIATGANSKLLQEIVFPKFNIPKVFSQIITPDDLIDTLHAKPHPESINRILKEQHFSSKETVVVGDAKNDVLMAQAAGVEAIVVLTGHLSEYEAKELGVKHIVESVVALEGLLSKL